MTRKLSLFVYLILKFLDKIFNILTNRSFLSWVKIFLESDSYKSFKLFENNLVFFVPNQLTEWRVNTILSKEPETLGWIDSFERKGDLIFWDGHVGIITSEKQMIHANAFKMMVSIENIQDVIKQIKKR